MKAPVVGIDHLTEADAIRVRRALRAEIYSAYLIDGWVIVVSGERDKIERIAMRACNLSLPRVRHITMDGQEINEVSSDPTQFILITDKWLREQEEASAKRRMYSIPGDPVAGTGNKTKEL